MEYTEEIERRRLHFLLLTLIIMGAPTQLPLRVVNFSTGSGNRQIEGRPTAEAPRKASNPADVSTINLQKQQENMHTHACMHACIVHALHACLSPSTSTRAMTLETTERRAEVS